MLYRLSYMSINQKTKLERAAGIEPASSAWKAEVLPLHNARAARLVAISLGLERQAVCRAVPSMTLIGDILRLSCKLKFLTPTRPKQEHDHWRFPQHEHVYQFRLQQVLCVHFP